MPRKRRTISIDEELLNAIDQLSNKSGVKSFSTYVEKLLAAHAVANNQLPPNYQPPGETRGGDRTSMQMENQTIKSGLNPRV
jgi:hypothetical protein